jgi:transposase
MRVAVPVIIKNDDDETKFLSWSRGRSSPYRLVLRSKIVLLASEGSQNKQIAEKLSTHEHTVTKWRNRFAELGMAGIVRDAPRLGRRPKL